MRSLGYRQSPFAEYHSKAIISFFSSDTCASRLECSHGLSPGLLHTSLGILEPVAPRGMRHVLMVKGRNTRKQAYHASKCQTPCWCDVRGHPVCVMLVSHAGQCLPRRSRGTGRYFATLEIEELGGEVDILYIYILYTIYPKCKGKKMSDSVVFKTEPAGFLTD